jgi:hypothetical protein
MRRETGPRKFDDSRFLLWVDGVGGYLVSPNREVILGQATPGNRIHIPILGDLSRHHAHIRRQGENYLVEPLAKVILNGEEISGPRLLASDDELQLGDVVRLRFRQPHALSATARLDFLTPHRTLPSVDGVLLMAESIVLGPRKSNHVPCKHWTRDVILFRKDEQLYCRAMGDLEIDGRICSGKGELTLESHVLGDDFSLSLESVRGGM